MIPGIGGFDPAQLIDRTTERFRSADANEDDAVSRAEAFAAAETGGLDPAIAERIFGALDADGDGLITRDEHQAGVQAVVDKLNGLFSDGTGGEPSFDVVQAFLDRLSASDDEDDGNETRARLEAIRNRAASAGLSDRDLSDLTSLVRTTIRGVDIRV